VFAGLDAAERTHFDRVHALKKTATSRDARKIRAILPYTQDDGCVSLCLLDLSCEMLRITFAMTRCSAIGLLPQRATLATVASEAWGTT